MNIKKYLKNTKNIYTILGIVFSATLLFNISIFFSSIRNYLIENVKREIGDYHVIIQGKIKDNDVILKKKNKGDRIYITFKNIYRVYIDTDKICNKCKSITYNDKLLSLYGLSKKENIMLTMKKILIFTLLSLSIILFFIIYNSFKVRIIKQKKDICLFKLSGCTNWDIFKIYIKETTAIGIIGTVLGFIISIIINIILILFINNMPGEVFDNLKININISFLFISFLFIQILIYTSSLIPLLNIKKYRPMELFRNKDNIELVSIKLEDNISLWLAKINYLRQNKKYRSLIISIFVACLFINIFSLFLKYGIRCINDYIIIPKYDLIVTSDDYKLDKIAKELKGSKLLYRTCIKQVDVHNKKYTFLITDLGKNEIINKKERIIEEDGKIERKKQKLFQKLDKITIDNQDIDIKLSDDSKIIDDNIILNLEKDYFDNICDASKNNLLLNTDYKGIDKYMEKLIKKEKLNINYINIKKEREIINNIIIVIKAILYLISILIIIITISSVISTTSASIEYRKKELSTFKSIGLDDERINYSLFIESLIVSFQGWLYSLPLIFIINKYMIISIKEVFEDQTIITNIDIIILTFIIIESIVFISLMISNKRIKKEMIDIIKER